MGVRRDKGKAVTRYLTGSTGIPSLHWEGMGNSIEAPSPYVIDLTTARKLENWHEILRTEGPGIRIAIRYDGSLDSVEQAWVGLSLRDFAPMLKAHYESRRGNE
jgi:hypothetical protein